MSLLRSIPLLLVLLASSVNVQVHAAVPTLMVHGSGTTNPEKCFGSIIENFQARAKLPMRMTYRSIGTTGGLDEFINGFEDNPIIDFASGEIPVSSENYDEFKGKNVTILHLPALFGAVSFFHSVPGVDNLSLTSCILARIFTLDVTKWNHRDILELNPNLEAQLTNGEEGLPIRVAVRESGSGNTLAITQYLHKACPAHFPETMVGSLPDWAPDTVACRGNSGMLTCIEQEAGTIGYLEAGTGVDAGLPEISLKNKYGRTLNSKQAAAYNGIGAKEQGVLPTDPSVDFGSVSLLDQNGEFTWPITLLTYVYVRLDLSFMEEPVERSLLVAFLKALYDPEFVNVCRDRYGFTLAEGVSFDLAQRAISMLESNLGPDIPQWTFEYKPNTIVGAGDYVISTTRKSLPQDERESNLEMVRELTLAVNTLQAEVDLLKMAQGGGSLEGTEDEAEFTEKYQAMILAGLVIATLGFLLALVAVALPFVRGGPYKG